MKTPSSSAIRAAAAAIFGLFLSVPAAADSVVVFNEILYHPATNEGQLEWVELYNQMGVDVDISNWSLADGISYRFSEGTIVPGSSYLVVALSPAGLEAATGFTGALGPFFGRLDNSGDRLELRDINNRLMDAVEYRDGGDWPEAADGSGVSVAKILPNSASEPPESWAFSAQVNGTPGKANFPEGNPRAGRTLAFNETMIDSQGASWLEIVNTSAAEVQLAGHVLVETGGTPGEYVFPAGALAAGGFLLLPETTLGWKPAAGDRVFLFQPGRLAVQDAERLQENNRGRHPQGAGRWLHPDLATPGAANHFTFHDGIVINEIQYHPRSTPAIPAEMETRAILSIDASWRFDQSGTDRAAGWRDPDFDDGAWPSGKAIFFNETGALPEPKNTPLALGPVTYYFRTEFQFDGNPATTQLSLRYLIDDGAIFYLNGIEMHRFNMPAGEAAASTLASPSVGNSTFRGPLSIGAAAGLAAGRNVLAVEVHQATPDSDDVVFAASLQATVTTREAVPFQESKESWIELFNRSSAEVDMTGWRLDGGIDYEFEAGTRLAPGEFLVVAKDRAFLEALYPDIRIAGDFQKTLSRKSDRLVLEDAAGNPADEVRYYDGATWPEYADGGGSTLELRDPHADNNRAESWAASDESGKGRWQQFSYRAAAAANVGPTRWNEFIAGLLDAGEALIDDLNVIEAPDAAATPLLTNGSFDTGATGWRMLGTHRLSTAAVDPEDPNNPVLRLIATGASEHMHNHLETTLAANRAIANGREYQVSFRARWLAGSNQLNTRLYFNRLPKTSLLAVPDRTGTPGKPNSRFVENLGPVYTELAHAPVTPEVDQAVAVSVRAEDPDAVAGNTLWWSVNGGEWSSAPMAQQPGSLYSAVIPGQPKAAVVQFYVEGTDGRGAISTFPALGRNSRALYKVNDGQARLGVAHNFRIILTPADTNFLHLDTNVMSNESLRCTVVYDEQEAFHDVGVSLRGSERGRVVDQRVGFIIKFHPDRLFRGVHSSISIDRSGGWIFGGQFGQDEIVIKHIINHAGGIPGCYDDLIRVIAPRPAHTSPALLMMAKFGDVYLDSQYENGGDGTVYKLELIYYPTTTNNGRPDGLKRPQPDEVTGTDLRDLGPDKELYRWTFLIENNRDRDDYSGMIELCKTLTLTGAQLEARAQETMDVDEWLRSFAMYGLCGINDTYTFGNNHNNLYYRRPSDGRMLVFPWDMDFAFVRGISDSLWGDQNLSKIFQLARFQRLFYRHIRDLCNTTYNGAYMGRWITHYGTLAGRSYAPILNYINQRRTFAMSRVPKEIAFAITTNSGQDLTVNEVSTLIEGSAWIDVDRISLASRPDEALPITWANATRWRASVPLEFGENALSFLAQSDGNPVPLATASIKVTSMAGWPRPVIRSISPAPGTAGARVAITGDSFHAGLAVFFGSRPAPGVVFDEAADPQTITAIIPQLAPGPVEVTVRNADNRASEPFDYAIIPSDAPLFIRGDANGSGSVNVSDAAAILAHLFRGQALRCLDAADVDDSEVVEATDAILLLGVLFLNAPPPPAPFPQAGIDPSGTAIGCEG